MNRRSFLFAAPAVILTPGLLMPVKAVGFTTGLVTLPNTFPVGDVMTATEVLLRQREAFARMAYLVANPPLIAIKDAPFAPIRYEPMRLSMPPFLGADRDEQKRDRKEKRQRGDLATVSVKH